MDVLGEGQSSDLGLMGGKGSEGGVEQCLLEGLYGRYWELCWTEGESSEVEECGEERQGY